MTRERAIELIGSMKGDLCDFYDDNDLIALEMAISALSDYDKMQEISLDLAFENDELINKSRWIPFSEELPPKGKKVHVSTYGIVTIGERTSEANEALRLSILEPMNNMYKNVDPYSYQITHWQPLPEPYKADMRGE